MPFFSFDLKLFSVIVGYNNLCIPTDLVPFDLPPHVKPTVVEAR